jgi:hypothetical protein
MLATVIFVLGVIRRALKKTGRGLSITADAFDEALRNCHAARRKYPFAE